MCSSPGMVRMCSPGIVRVGALGWYGQGGFTTWYGHGGFTMYSGWYGLRQGASTTKLSP